MTYPDSPGCYLHKDAKEVIIYVGKAKNLKKRIASYFNNSLKDPKTTELVKRIKKTEFIITNSEVEALILENNLIKKHQPKYNINLLDSKRYAYLQITSEKFPRLLIARKKDTKCKYFGPFTSAQTRDYVKETLTKTFRLRTCKKLPKKACLRYHIKLCDAPCIKEISEDTYDTNIKMVENILKGNTSKLVPKLKNEMKKASKLLYFEKALDLRNKIQAIEWLKEKQNMERQKKIDEDVINYIIKDNMVYLMVFNISKGIVLNKQVFEFHYNKAFLEQFMLQFYTNNQIPKEIILPQKVDAIKEYLEQIKKSKVIITIPQKGEKKNLLNLVEKNIEIQYFQESEKLDDLKNQLKLQEDPVVIECFDISHLQGTATVASMVQFKNAKPNKSQYRRYKLKTIEGIDDFKSIAEVVKRRYSRLLMEKTTLPNLIVIDGGKGQLSSAIKILQDLNIKIPIISLAKRDEEIFVPGLSFPIKLNKKRPGLKLLQNIRDEAHRFAINYNRLLRRKEKLNA